MTAILTDDDLGSPQLMSVAIEAVELAMHQRATGKLISPPRHHVPFGDKAGLTFTVGGSDAHAGFRVYDTFPGKHHTQLVAVWSPISAELECVVLGERLGQLRTGAIGGVALRHMSNPDAHTVAILGSGRQARMQLEAAAAVRTIEWVKVFSRNESGRARFVEEMSARLGLAVEARESASSAVAGAEIVICATTSNASVLDASWLIPGAHVTTVGPKTVDAHEIGVDVADWAQIIATDSPEQTQAYKTPFFLDGTAAAERLLDLTEIVTGTHHARSAGTTNTLFCSVGLAGTEVLVAAAIARHFGQHTQN